MSTLFTNLGKKDDLGKQVRIEHRGRFIRVSRTGGVSVRAQAKAAGLNVTVNSQQGVRVSTQLAKGTQVALQNGRVQLRGRYGKGPHKVNLSKSGVTVSSRNALGTFNWVKPNRSSAKLFGVQVRGKKAAQLHLVYALFELVHASIVTLLLLLQFIANSLVWLVNKSAVLARKGAATGARAIAALQTSRQRKQVAQRLATAPVSWRQTIDVMTAPERVAALVWVLWVWGQGRSELDATKTMTSPRLRLSYPIDNTMLAAAGEQLNALSQDFQTPLIDELAVLACLCHTQVQEESAKLVEDILHLDERLSKQGKTCLQETMILLALDYAGARLS